MILLSRTGGIMLHGKCSVDFFPTSDLLIPNMKVLLQLTRRRPNVHMISDKFNVSLGYVKFSISTACIADPMDSFHKKLDMLA